MQVEQIDREAAQGFGCGFCPDDADEFLTEAFARHRHQARDELVQEIVAWLREDADLTEQEATRIVRNTTGNPRKNAAEWTMLIDLKRGIAKAIEAKFG